MQAEQDAAELELVTRIRAGDLSAFEQVMRRCNRTIFRAARSIVRDDDEAEDIMQEAYVRAFTNFDSFEGRSRLSTWIVRIAVHEAYNRMRRRGRSTPTDPTDEASPLHDSVDDMNPERAFADKELGGLLEQAIDRLPESFRPAFVLKMIEQLSTADVAACLEVPEETVRTRVFRARALLRRTILKQTNDGLGDTFGFHLKRCDRVVSSVLARLYRH